MKNYQSSDYAINKNAKGIVYRFADQTVEVTFEDYLRENPGKTAADFAELKALSDEDYYDSDRSGYRQTWKNTSLNTLDEDENAIFAVPSPEDEIIERGEQEAAYAKRKSVALHALDKLTDIQRRRYIQYHVEGMTEREIAEKECSTQQAVSKSLAWAEKKIKKVLPNTKK
jgi:DNA-directed RNA polymerase specialized sigma24 family protein